MNWLSKALPSFSRKIAMVYRPKIDDRLCFVLMPFQELHLEYFRGIISPAAEALGLRARKADDIYGTAPIIQDIWRAIWAAKVVIADVTGRNPNVNYELGICHTLGVPTVLITQDIADVPFDYRHRRCIVYDTRRVNWQEKLRQDISLTLEVVLGGTEPPDELIWPYNTRDAQGASKKGLFVPTEEAQDGILRGVALGSAAVARALGPHGTSVSIPSSLGEESTDRSGALILAALDAAEPLMRRGLEQLRFVTREVSSELGDGTKTTALLLAEMLVHGFAALRDGFVLRDLVHDMDVAVEAAVNYVEQQSTATNPSGTAAVAMTAALGDKLTGKIVDEAVSKAGPDGIIYFEDSPDVNTSIEVREGMYFDRGFLTSRFITDEPKQLAILDHPHVFLYSGKLSSMRSLLPLLEQVARIKGSLLIVADDVEGEALETLVTNHQRGTLRSVAVRSPGHESRQALLEDIAVATGGVVFAPSQTVLESVFLGQLGRADKVEVSKDTTWFTGGKGEVGLVESRAAGIRQQISVAGADYEREKLRERLAKLVGRTAVIRVGGASVVDRRERRYRISTSIHSTQAALESGVVPGGGNTLWRARALALHTGNNPGSHAVAEALRVPLLTQLKNSRVSATNVIAEIEASSDAAIGFNAESRASANLLRDGVLDATKVVVRSLQIAFSHARTVLQTGAWDISEPTRAPAGPNRDFEGNS